MSSLAPLTRSLLASALTAACSATPHSDGRAVPSASPTASASASAISAPPALPTVREKPSSGAVVLVAKTSSLIDLRERLLVFGGAPLGKAFSALTSLPAESLIDPNLLGTLGIDPEGVMVAESYELDAAAEELEATARGLSRGAPDAELGEKLLVAHRAKRAGWFMSRVKLPKAPGRPEILASTIERALVRVGASPVAGPVLNASAFTQGRSIWLLRQDPSSVELELAIGDAPANASDVPNAAAALLAWSATPPSLGAGETARLTMSPPAARPATFFLATEQLVSEAEKKSSTMDLDAPLGAAFRQAFDILELDAPEGADRYRSVTISVSNDGVVVLHALLADKTEAFDPAEWRADGSDVAIAGADVVFSVNGSLLYGWPMTSASPELNPYFGHTIEHTLDNAGPMVLPQLAGDMGPFLARDVMEEAEVTSAHSPDFVNRFERVGLALVPVEHALHDGLFFGLVVEGAKDEQAACALAQSWASCPVGERLAVNRTVDRSGFRIVRRVVEGRSVIVASRRQALVDSARLKIVKGNRAAALVTVDTPNFLVDSELADKEEAARIARFPAYSLSAEVDADKRGYRVTLRPTAKSP